MRSKSLDAVVYGGRSFTIQRVLRADKLGHVWLWSEDAAPGAVALAESRDQVLLAIGFRVATTTRSPSVIDVTSLFAPTEVFTATKEEPVAVFETIFDGGRTE